MKRCETCRYCEWEVVDTDRGSYTDICGCTCVSADKLDEECGDTKDCPEWESADKLDEECGDTKDCPEWEGK